MTPRIAILVLGATLLAVGPLSAATTPRNPDWEKFEAAMVRHDNVEARRIAEALAQAGDPEAINGLAMLISFGMGGPADPQRARALWERAAAAGSLAAKLNLARAIMRDGDRNQFPRVLSLLQDVMKKPKLSEGAYYPLGKVLAFGGHGPDELKQGVAYLKQAVVVEPTNADVQFLVARAYQGGWGGSEKNPSKAFEHFLEGSKLGDERALRYVGMARLTGDGVAKDPPAALVDFKAAAEHGSQWAMIDVAAMLALGEGVPADPPQARVWYRRAAELGSAHGMRGLGVMLYRGEGGPIDRTTGRVLLELAVEASDTAARQIAPVLMPEVPSPAERTAIDAAKSAWLKAYPAPKAD